MGLETKCVARLGRERSEGKALLETDEVLFRGDFRVKIPLRSIQSAEAKAGVLTLRHAEGTLALELGDAAAKWAERIRNPKSVLDKLGVKPGQSVAILGVKDASLAPGLKKLGARVTTRVAKALDVVFLGAERANALDRLEAIETRIARNGTIWVLWPKGRADLNEDSVRAAAKRAGLVDVKVVRYSETHGALKLVIPLKRR